MFDFAVSTPANTTQAAAQRTDMALEVGVINLVHIAFPAGPQGLLHVVIERGGSTLWPRNRADGFAWDNFTIAFNPMYEIEAAPELLTALTWNDDDTFAHQATLRFNVVPFEVAFPPRPEIGILQQLTGMFTSRRRGGG